MPQLVPAASRQQPYQWSVEARLSLFRRRNAFDQRMSYVTGIDAALAKKRLFERKDDHQPPHGAPHRFRPFFFPRPRLRRNVVQDGNPPFVRRLRQPQVEAGIIHQHHGVWLPLIPYPHRPRLQPEDRWQMLQDFHKTY